jgi:hypothetical protein
LTVFSVGIPIGQLLLNIILIEQYAEKGVDTTEIKMRETKLTFRLESAGNENREFRVNVYGDDLRKLLLEGFKIKNVELKFVEQKEIILEELNISPKDVTHDQF